MFLYYITMFPGRSESALLGMGDYCSTPWRAVPSRVFHHGKFVAASYDCHFSHCQEQGMGMSHPLVGLSQVQDKAGPQDGIRAGGREKNWKKTGVSF